MQCHGCKEDVPFYTLKKVGEPYISVRIYGSESPVEVKRQTELCPKCLKVRLKYETHMKTWRHQKGAV